MQTPKELGFRMPAEWEKHSAVWLAWPHDEIAFPNRIPQAEDAVVEMIAAIHESETVELIVLNETMKKRAEEKLEARKISTSNIHFRVVEYLGGWMRDAGGLWVTDAKGAAAVVGFRFNAWGDKFPDVQIDAALPTHVSSWHNVPLFEHDAVIEGGAIDVNGTGVCLTTEQCLLNENRNSGKTKTDMEEYLAEYLGIRKTIWLPEGLVNDHTDGHIDELARFVAPNKILCAYEDDPEDANYAILKKNYEILTAATDADGKPFEVIKLPMPNLYYTDAAVGLEKGAKEPASYANFYIGNTVVLASVYNDPNDEKAMEILRSVFPRHTVVGIDCSQIIYGGGAVHCLTQQQPAV